MYVCVLISSLKMREPASRFWGREKLLNVIAKKKKENEILLIKVLDKKQFSQIDDNFPKNTMVQ